MTYIGNLNQALAGDPVTLVQDGPRSSGGTGTTVPVDRATTVRVDLVVSAVSGTTPVLTVTLEHSPDGQSWSTHSSFTAATAAGAQRKVTAGLDRFIRCSWTLTGTTPSATFRVAGELV